ncbi:MAG TPA: helix-hairpin-helix domain-containing protein [Chloroflexota bacterium]|nr:helix-hairpin-helix domain-containing protein [Chloroflexota bacterium]
MNSTILIVLLLLVGGMFGALLVFLVDWRYWGRREQKVMGERNKAQAMNQVTQARLQRAEKGQLIAQKDVESLRQDVAERDERVQQQQAELQTQKQKLETAVTEINQLQTRLRQTTVQLEDLQERAQALQNTLLTSTAEKNLLHESNGRLENQLDAARAENQQICQRVAVMEVELKHLRDDLVEAQGWQERAAALKTENEALVGQLNRAEIHINELQAQVEVAAHQLTDAQILGKKLVEMQTRLKEAETQTEMLQGKMTAVQHTFDYTGKNQLQLIRGIGPAYARRLNEAGILTLEDLAQCAPDQIAEIIQPKKWQHLQPEEWIREAKALTVKISRS